MQLIIDVDTLNELLNFAVVVRVGPFTLIFDNRLEDYGKPITHAAWKEEDDDEKSAD